MQYLSALRHVARTVTTARRAFFPVLALGVLALPGLAQQSYVGRYDLYAGYMYLNSPHVSLGEPGLHLQAGYRPNGWVSLGFDYSYGKGSLTLKPDMLTDSLQQTLGAQLGALIKAGQIPANYSLVVPVDSTTQTFSAGPQVAIRHFKTFTIFLRPDLGLIREVATPRPTDAVATAIVKQLAPSGKKTDNVVFYGFGGGVDVNISKHYSIRFQVDLVRDHLFDDMLRDSRNTVRFAIGPGVQWGKNAKK